MKIKICGVTTIEDALMCAEAGADLIGLNFYPKSPRHLSRESASAIATALRALPNPPTLVGVFVNETAETMNAVLDECNLDLAQLSGDEPEDVLAAMGARGFRVLRDSQLWQTPEAERRGPITNYQLLLLDAHAPGQYGGTGQTADWEKAADIAKQCRLLLAGGLTPENVAAAVSKVKPWGVDVASGVESKPGVKDRTKVIAFIERAKSVWTTDP